MFFNEIHFASFLKRPATLKDIPGQRKEGHATAACTFHDLTQPPQVIKAQSTADSSHVCVMSLLQQKLELDRLRSAITIVERMRQAGISCELFNNPENGH